MTEQNPAIEHREEIAVIGGGLGGCLTALMLAKNPNYHITLIEASPTLLNGASVIASRLHLGGEYPLDPVTAQDCLYGAIAWKMLMPKNIYMTAVPRMKFLVDKRTQEDGQEEEKRKAEANHTGEPYEEKKALTVEKAFAAYEKIRAKYQDIFGRIQKAFGWNEAKTGTQLFGSYKEGKFFSRLEPDPPEKHDAESLGKHRPDYPGWSVGSYSGLEAFRKPGPDSDVYAGYTNVAGGFQSQEVGLNVPKYLSMIEQALEDQQRTGKIDILTGYKVKKYGIHGEDKNFKIHCENGEIIDASQVVQAAWSGGPELYREANPEQAKKKNFKVSQRAMLIVDLPDGWKIPPAFIMLGDHGGMLSPFNDKVALCYIPSTSAAYRQDKEAILTSANPSLDPDWNNIRDEDQEQIMEGKQRNPFFKSLKEQWTARYFREAQARFPALKAATNPRLIIRDTVIFEDKEIVLPQAHAPGSTQDGLDQRRYEHAAERAVEPSFNMRMEQLLREEMRMDQEKHLPTDEAARGFFTLYPTKATYAVLAALQAASMVEKRSVNRQGDLIKAPDADTTLDMILSPQKRAHYSLADMPLRNNHIFISRHPEFSQNMLLNQWPASQAEKIRSRRSEQHRQDGHGLE